MIIALTGTPGTGKTSISKELDNFKTLDLTKFVKQKELGLQKDEFEADIDQMVKALEEEIDGKEDTVIEGHLSHHFPVDYCIVLRCNPEKLRERLSKRDYAKQKIEENVESEILDVLLSESVRTQVNIIEIDTTNREAEDVAMEIKK